ncbi:MULTISPECIES: hypothetical protein [Streptomyces]|uniref:hypothetical protein n=1 Tax=Streptomyces TaxID=1883 RepID=UPI001C3091AF|nr:hypothetical protein [Streptomyces sp. GbtcB7]
MPAGKFDGLTEAVSSPILEELGQRLRLCLGHRVLGHGGAELASPGPLRPDCFGDGLELALHLRRLAF